jgi:hypothetical protein
MELVKPDHGRAEHSIQVPWYVGPISRGEVMLRIDSGDERASTTRHFRVWKGGGEYNFARGLGRCFAMETATVTALADNPVGRQGEDLMPQGGVSQKYVRWAQYDGVGRTDFWKGKILSGPSTAVPPSSTRSDHAGRYDDGDARRSIADDEIANGAHSTLLIKS